MIIGTGVDITEVTRLRQAVEKWGQDFLNRIFTQEELENAKTRGSLYQHLAGRFAAKEAVMKALGTGNKDIAWHEIEILSDDEGQPIVHLHNKACHKADSFGLQGFAISLSHTRKYAVAFVVGESMTS